MSDGTRKIISISEVVGMEGEVVTMQDIFDFTKTGIGEKGEVLGEFFPTGVRPRLSRALACCGDPVAGWECLIVPEAFEGPRMEFALAALTFAIVVLILLLAFALGGGGRKNVVKQPPGGYRKGSPARLRLSAIEAASRRSPKQRAERSTACSCAGTGRGGCASLHRPSRDLTSCPAS